jgi:2-C-methyl-D-erythritol 4-phosphate cytidylyltransferase
MKKHVVIVAGGKGMRMNTTLPKQFIPIGGLPILMHTIEAFFRYDNKINIILVLPKDDISFWENLCKKHSFSINHKIAQGGETRFHSVMNGLQEIKETGLVAVHDGVRPFVSAKMIERCFETARQKNNAVPVVEPTDSIRKIENGRNFAVNRADFKLVQTPQVFDVEMLKKAYEKATPTSLKEAYSNDAKSPVGDLGVFTDDASVFTFAGHEINLVEGERENIKITTAFDLIIAEVMIKPPSPLNPHEGQGC